MSHLIDPQLLRADNFHEFMADRQKQLLSLIERATGKTPYGGSVEEEGIDVDGDAIEAAMAVSATAN
jgi:hypothetical protein